MSEFENATKLSEVISLAVEDVKACFANPHYHIDMGYWHVPDMKPTCAVCFAGSVMANRLGLAKEIMVSGPFDGNLFNDDLVDKFLTLDYIRRGRLNDIEARFMDEQDRTKFFCLVDQRVFDWLLPNLKYDDDYKVCRIVHSGKFDDSTMQYFLQTMTRFVHELKAFDL